MKTLADIRRRFGPGVRLEVIKQTRLPDQVGSIRTVRQSRTTDIVWEPSEEGKRCGHSDWPKAKDVRITGDDSFEYDLVDRDGAKYGTVGLRFLPELTEREEQAS